MKLHVPIFILLLAGLWVLPACSAGPTPPLTATALPVSSLTPSETSRPSMTPVPSNTLLPTVTPTLPLTSTPTVTSSATPRPVFAGFQVDFVEYAYYGMQFAFKIPGIQQNYRLLANGISFKCTLYEKYPDKLYCTGPAIKPLTEIAFSFLPLAGSEVPVFETKYKLGSMITPTINLETLAASNPTTCPQHGVNVRCETEYRKIASGCCVVATCVDACGYYFSVDTCPQDMEMQGICEGVPPIPYPK